MASVGWPLGGRTLHVMLIGDVFQGYYMHQPPKQGCHLQLRVVEARLSF